MLLTLALLLGAIITARLLITAPSRPHVHPSLAALPLTHRARTIYPADVYGPGANARLPLGTTRYWLLGPPDGEKIVLVPGLSMTSLLWKDVAQQLARRGYRVLMYDLYGRGYSDTPSTTYNTELFTTQLALLLQHVGWEKAHIAGGSMGGGIAAAFAVHFPRLVAGKVILVGPTGLIEYSDLSWKMRLNASPLSGWITSSVPYRFYLERFCPVSSDDMTAIVQLQAAHLAGFNYSFSSTLRDGPIHSLTPAFATLGSLGFQVLAIWGTDDDVMPYGLTKKLQALVPQTELVAVEGGDHDVSLSYPDEVAKTMYEWLEREKR